MNREDIQFSKENQTRGQKTATIDQVKQDPRRSKLGQGRGLAFAFRLREVIWLPKIEEAWPIFRDFNGTEVMYIAGYSETRDRFVEIPVSTFRRIPVGEGEVDSFFDESVRPLNCYLAQSNLTDLERFIKLCNVGKIVCDDIVDAHGPVFESDGNGGVRRVKDEYKDIRLASIQPAE